MASTPNPPRGDGAQLPSEGNASRTLFVVAAIVFVVGAIAAFAGEAPEAAIGFLVVAIIALVLAFKGPGPKS